MGAWTTNLWRTPRLPWPGRLLLDKLPLLLFGFSIAATLVAYGIAIERFDIFPAPVISSAAKTFRVLLDQDTKIDDGSFTSFSEVSLEDLASSRARFLVGDSFSQPMLITGGKYQYLEHCPENGCLAVILSPGGEVLHAYPFRPEAIFAANSTEDYEYEANRFSVSRDFQPVGIQRYPNGDLLVVFWQEGSFPREAE